MWVPLVVAGIGVAGTLIGGISGGLIAQRRASQREKHAWAREREREQQRWAREDEARTFELRREVFEELYQAVKALARRAYDHGYGFDNTPELPFDWHADAFAKLTRVGLYADRRVAVQVSSLVHEAITDEFGVDSTVIVRDLAQLQDVVAANPFAAQVDTRPHLVRAIFLAGQPAPQLVAAVSDDARLRQVSCVVGEHVYVDYAEGVHGNSRTASFFERALRVQGTERNWRSALALHKMTLPGGSNS